MKVFDLCNLTDFVPAVKTDQEREITSVYCCDLLSLAMVRAPAEGAWVTVMGNINVVAVASLAEVSCIIVAEGMPVDAGAMARAEEKEIAVFTTDLPVFEAAKVVDSLL